MRSSKSRSRSKTNRPRTLGNIINRVFDSSGPEGKVRGTPAQLIEKYQFLARDAQLSNDRVAAENFLQHAEHYTRLLAEANRELAAEQESRPQYQQPAHTGNGNQGGGQSYQNGPGGQNQQRDRQQNDRQNDRPQNDRPQNDRSQNDRPQNDRPQNDRDQPRADYRPDARADYRHDSADEQPIVTAHDLVDHVRYDDAGLVETPEAGPKPRNDEPRRNDRPRYDRNRDENRRSYPPRVEQPQADRPADTKVEAPPPQAAPAPQQPVSPPLSFGQSAMMPPMPAQETAPRPAPKPRAKAAAAQAPAAEATTEAAKPRLAPRPRAAKKPVDVDSDTGPSEVTSD